MGNYQRIISQIPEIADQHAEQNELIAKVREVVAFLPHPQSDIVRCLISEFTDVRNDLYEQLEDSFDQVDVVVRLASEVDQLQRVLLIAAGLLSGMEPYTDKHPLDIVAMLTTMANHPRRGRTP